MNSKWMFGTALAALIVATPAVAQVAPEIQLEPYVGAFNDSYDISPDNDNTGFMAGIRAGYPVGERLRLVGNLAYANTSNVSNPNGLASYWMYDNVWVMSTVGGEYDVISGSTSAAVGLQAGFGWRKNTLSGEVGSPHPSTDEYSHGGFTPMDVIVPGITVRQRLTRRTALSVTLQDQIFDVLEGPSNHSPSLTVGVSVR